jgi:hypothetical protein
MREAVPRILLSLALCAALALAAVGVAAADGERLSPVWATINICDSGAGQVGARVSVPGDGADATAFARFSLQWYSERQGAWLPVTGAAASPWLEVGSSRISSQQAGYTFQLDHPAGRPVQVRALAEVQWRGGAGVLRSASAVTQAGVASDIGGSQAACTLS